jgi:hypothetical protein
MGSAVNILHSFLGSWLLHPGQCKSKYKMVAQKFDENL